MKPSVTGIIKVSSTCNLACKYCYATDKKGMVNLEKIMPFSTKEKIIRELANMANNEVHYIWHGGEPLLGGKDFFAEVLEIQSQYTRDGLNMINHIQTNATLLTPELAQFFSENGFLVGVSIDGYENIHNHIRKNMNGKGSFNEVMRGIRILQEHNDGSVAILAVVSKNTLSNAKSVFDFFIDNNIRSFDFLPFVCYDENSNLVDDSITADEFGKFMIEVFDYWIEKDDPEIEVRFFDNALTGLLGGVPHVCTFGKKCGEFFAFDTNGDVFMCDWFIGQNEHKFGNINITTLDDITALPAYKSYIGEVKRIKKECVDCRWLSACGGGCTHHRNIQGSFNQKYYYCDSRKMIFDYVTERIAPIAEKTQ